MKLTGPQANLLSPNRIFLVLLVFGGQLVAQNLSPALLLQAATL